MKRGRRILLIAAGAVAALAVVFLLWPGEREPSYQGKKLSEWLAVCEAVRSQGSESETQAAQEAVRHIGTNAIPVLLDWLEYEPPPWKKKLISVARHRLPGKWGEMPFLEPFLEGEAAERPNLASIGFEILGPEAGCAVPELARRMNTNTGIPGRVAVLALANIGKEGLPPLLAAITNAQALNRRLAVISIGVVMPGPTMSNALAAAEAVPVLVQCIGDKDPLIAASSVRTLGQLKILPNLAIPALTNAFADPRADVRGAATFALGRFSQEDLSLIPLISAALNDDDPAVRKVATNALQQLRPEVLANPKTK